ncbi:MAG: hypothetical protein U0840_14310 [Gemmataceae bacterium]
MLAEWIERLFSTCPLPLRELGCLREMLGIRRRWRLHRTAWSAHCEATRRFLLHTLDRCPSKRKVVVLGSGWLHDVPLDELAQRFQQVILVDVFHPWAVRWQARRHGHVTLVAGDVTGVLDQVWQAGYETLASLPTPRPQVFTSTDDLDLTVSLNLLSQLPVMPEQYLLRSGYYTRAAVQTLCRNLVQAHLDLLAGLPGQVALITDMEIRTLDATGQVVRASPTLYGATLPWQGESWDWTLVPPRPAPPHHAEVLRVVAINDRSPAVSRAPAVAPA